MQSDLGFLFSVCAHASVSAFLFSSQIHTKSLLSLYTEDQLSAFLDNETLHMPNKAVVTQGLCSLFEKTPKAGRFLSSTFLSRKQSEPPEEMMGHKHQSNVPPLYIFSTAKKGTYYKVILCALSQKHN